MKKNNNIKNNLRIFKIYYIALFFLIFLFFPLNVYSYKFAIIGDFGELNENSRAVSALVKSWNPNFIITTGDNNYPSGAEDTIDVNVGSLYSEYIYPYYGNYKPSSVQKNRFFPCLGNHDFDTDAGGPYLKYFSLPGNGRYYDFVEGDVHFFALSSDPREPDGIDIDSKQAEWIKNRLKESSSTFNIVYFHHPVYSSTNAFYAKNGEKKIDYPFADWGASLVVNGHAHLYERFEKSGIPYVINGLGGFSSYDFSDSNPESLVRFTGDYGAMLAEVNENMIVFKFITISGKEIDQFVLLKKK